MRPADAAQWSTKSISRGRQIDSSFDDTLASDSGNNLLEGWYGNDSQEGNDTIGGMDGNDTLDGGLGDDSLSGGNGTDKIVLSKAAFGLGGSAGAVKDLAGLNTLAGAGVFTYDSVTGALTYDADGAGEGDPVTIAVIGQSVHPASLASDFLLAS